MIFKQIDEILSGQKTQTRRVVKPGEGMYKEALALTAAGNVKWAVGRTYAVVPWWAIVDGIPIWNHPVRYEPFYQPGEPTDWEDGHYVDLRHELEYQGFQPLRIRITAIRQERLQDITEADAKAEGVGSVAEYAALWDRLNTRKGTRWADNRDVFVLTFEVVRS